METPTYLSPGMVSIQPLYFNLPEKLNTALDTPLIVPASVNPSITVTFPENTDYPDGTPVDKVSFPSPSNVETVKIFKKSPIDQFWVELSPSGDSDVFDATEPIVFNNPIGVSLLKLVPQTSTDNDDDFKLKLELHACLQVTPATPATTSSMGIYILMLFYIVGLYARH